MGPENASAVFRPHYAGEITGLIEFEFEKDSSIIVFEKLPPLQQNVFIQLKRKADIFKFLWFKARGRS